MSISILHKDSLEFPPVSQADVSGVLAIGGDLSPERLKRAYQQGIFPWYNDDEPIVWWSPDPRFVLFPQDLKVSKSMQLYSSSIHNLTVIGPVHHIFGRENMVTIHAVTTFGGFHIMGSIYIEYFFPVNIPYVRRSISSIKRTLLS